jgi:membrane-bound inhibitor of C-type lysozyme
MPSGPGLRSDVEIIMNRRRLLCLVLLFVSAALSGIGCGFDVPFGPYPTGVTSLEGLADLANLPGGIDVSDLDTTGDSGDRLSIVFINDYDGSGREGASPADVHSIEIRDAGDSVLTSSTVATCDSQTLSADCGNLPLTIEISNAGETETITYDDTCPATVFVRVGLGPNGALVVWESWTGESTAAIDAVSDCLADLGL